MLAGLFLILIILWLLDYIHIEGLPPLPDFLLFKVNDQPVTLWIILTLVFICWAISITPSPLKQIISVILILWVLAILGIIAIGDIPIASILVLAIIIGIIVAMLRPDDSV